MLTSVDLAKTEQAAIAEATRRIAADIVSDPVRTVASGALLNFVADVERLVSSGELALVQSAGSLQ